MSFGQELKEFAAGFGTGVGLRHKVSQAKYYDARAGYYEDGAGKTGGFDITSDLKENEGYDPAEKPHGMLYNMGSWLGLNDGDKKPRANPASPIEAVSAAGAVPMDAYESQYAPDTDGYVGGYAQGGLVVDEEDPDQAAAAPVAAPPPRAVAMDDQPAPAVEEVTSTPQATAAPRSDMAAAENPQTDGATLSAALHGGIQALQSEFGLKQQGVPDQQSMAAGQQRLLSGDGRASQADMAAVARAVDPKGELSHSQMMLRAMTRGYNWYLERGQPDKANAYAASIIQYSTFQASKFGEDAVQLIQKGDMKGAAKAVAAGYSHLPDGKEASDIQVSPDGKSVTVTETDVATGKPINKHTLTGMQLYQGAIGLANKSESWKAIMSAAAAAKGVNLPPSDAYNGAVDRLNGVNADGTVTQPGNAPPAGYKPQGAVSEAPASSPAAGPQAQPQSNGNLISRADPSAMFLVESGNNPNAVSPKGARGVGQTMEGTLRDPGFGVAPAKDNSPQELQRVATDYLAAMNKNYGDPVVAHIAYNWGPGNTDQWLKQGGKFNQLPTETQQYLGRIAVAQSQGGRAAPTGAPAPQRPTAATAAAPKADFQRGQSMALRPALPEDQVEKPEIPEVGARPVAPEQLKVTSKDTEGMSGPERVNYTRMVAETNRARQKKFAEDMQLYNSSVSARDKAQKAAAKGGPKDEFKLPVKDRTDALTALKEARPDPADTTDLTAKQFAALQPSSQKAIDDIAYGLYTHNDTTPQRSYQAAVSMMNPKQQSFTPYEMSGDKVRIVFRSGDKLVMPKNTFDQLAALRGNEHYIARTAAEASDKTAAEDAALARSRGEAATAVINIGGQAVDAGKSALKAVDRSIGQVLTDPVKAGRKAVTKVGRGVLGALDKGLVHQR